MTKEHTSEEIKNRLSDLGVQIGNIAIEYITELESKIKHLTEHLEPQAMSALFEQVEEEVKHEQRIKELEQKTKELQHKVDTLQGYLDHDIEYDMDKTIQEQKLKIKELEQENKTLRTDCSDYLQTIKTLSRKLKQNVDLASKAVDTVEEWKKKYVKECEDVSYAVTNYNKQLTKAKEFLKTLLEDYVSEPEVFPDGSCEDNELRNLIKEVEQFLKEIEE